MTVYALAHGGGFKRIKITKHEDRAGALAWLEDTPNDMGGLVFENPEEISLGKGQLTDLFERVTGRSPAFTTRPEGQQSVFDAIVDDQKSDEFTTHVGDYQMAEKEKPAKATKEKVAKAPEAKEYPPGKVAEFKQVRAGSIRAKLLHLGNGKKNLDDIAKELDSSRANLRVTLNCLQRDCGIGFRIDENDRLTFLYPGSKTIADAIAQPAAKKEKPAKKAKAAEAQPAA